MTVTFDESALRDLVRPIIEEVVAKTGAVAGEHRLAVTEPEAARLLGIGAHQLRDARLRGEIVATRVGGRIGFEIEELRGYLARGRTDQ